MEIRTVKLGNDKDEMDAAVFGGGGRDMIILPGVSLRPVILSADAVAAGFAALARNRRVWLFDRRKNIPEGITAAQMAEDTAEAMRALKIGNADVFGASQGGMIGQCLAAAHPELVRRLAIGSSLSRPNALSRAVFSRWIALARAGDPRALNRDVFEKIYSPEYRERYGDVFAALEKEGTPEELERFARLVGACLTFDFYDELEKIRCPVLVIGARGDRTLDGAASAEIAQRLGCGLYMYDGYSHAVYDEAPDYRQRLMEFFDRQDENFSRKYFGQG